MDSLLLVAIVVFGVILVTVPAALVVALVQRLRGRSTRTPLLVASIAGITFALLMVGLALVLAVVGSVLGGGGGQYFSP